MALITCKDCKKEFSSDSKRCPHCGAKKRPQVTVLSLIVIGIWLWWMHSLFSPSSVSPVPSAASETSPSGLASNVTLKWDWAKAGLGSVMVADFSITNHNAEAVKDIEITCTHFGKSGTEIDKNVRTIFEIVAPGKTVRVRHFNMGFIHSQAASSSCEVTDTKRL